MLIGTRGHDLCAEKTTADILVMRAAAAGFSSLQLVPYKSLTGIDEHPGRISPAFAFETARAFREHGLHLALLGSYFNLLAEEEDLQHAKKRFCEYLLFARNFGCGLVGTETGSYMPDWSYHPDNHCEASFEKVKAVLLELTAMAEKQGVCLGIEGAWHHVVYSPQKMLSMLQALASDNVAVIFDPLNMFDPRGSKDARTAMRELVEESFQLFGERIAVLHAKDFILVNGERKQVPLGQGIIDYDHLLATAGKYKPSFDIIIEGLSGAELMAGREFLEKRIN